MQPENEGHPLPPLELEIAGLGTLQIAEFSVAVILDLDLNLTPEDRATDDVIVREFLARAASMKGAAEGHTRLSGDQVDNISSDNLERFARLCLDREDWLRPTELEPVEASATSRLAERLRQELKCKPIAWAGKDYLARAGFSDNTLRLLAESQKLSSQLNGLGALTDFSMAKRLADCKVVDGLEAAMKHARSQVSLDGIIDKKLIDSLRVSPTIAEAARAASRMDSIALPEVEIPRNLLKPLPSVGKEVGDKVDQVGKILGGHLVKLSVATETIAKLHDTTNQALISAIGDFKAQADKNERAARYALRVAAASMVVSAVIALFAYHQDGKNNEANDAIQARIYEAMTKQREAQERMTVAEESLAEYLRAEARASRPVVGPQSKRDGLKLPAK